MESAFSYHRAGNGFFLIGWWVLFSACAITQEGTKSQSIMKLKTDGVVIREQPEPTTGLLIYDADTLFHQAHEAGRQGQREKAIQIYQRLLTEFPQSRLLTAVRFNLGLLFEEEKAWDKAADQYMTIALEDEPKETSEVQTWLDAHFRLAVCSVKLEDYWRAVNIFDVILALPKLDDSNRLEALVGKGIALQEAKLPTDAEVVFAAALRLAQKIIEQHVFDDQGMAAEAAFRMGEISTERYQNIPLLFPQDVLMKNLEKKCEFLLEAQSRYFRAIRYGDAHTVAAAGFRIGSLYENLYDTIINLEAPKELTQEQIEIYNEEVRKRVRILVEKALLAYEKSFEVGKRASQTAQDWLERLEKAITRLKSLYLVDPNEP